jgi:short-subunit dehydrogenase
MEEGLCAIILLCNNYNQHFGISTHPTFLHEGKAMELQNKVIIVTGASSGIGLATAKLLAQNGAKVALVARTKYKLEEFSKKLPNSLAVPADMTKENQIREMVAKVVNHYGRVDILINCAGRGYDALIEKINIESFHEIFDLDVVGPLIAMQAVIPIMKKQGGGMIVNISSGTALMYLPNMGGYSSLKRALGGISLTAREELKKDNIIVSVFYPYITLTDFEKNTLREDDGIEWQEEHNHEYRPPDSAEYVAKKIMEGIISEETEVLAHDWMKNIH